MPKGSACGRKSSQGAIRGSQGAAYLLCHVSERIEQLRQSSAYAGWRREQPEVHLLAGTCSGYTSAPMPLEIFEVLTASGHESALRTHILTGILGTKMR